MRNNGYAISGALTDRERYYAGNTGKCFASPMKELNQKTVLTEDTNNNNDSYRQHTKYNDRMDCYYSTYDLGILLHNEESYLEGTIDSKQDVDYYSFAYQQKGFYSKMGISSDVTILLEGTEGRDYNLVVYDIYGNQIGMAKDNGNGIKELTLPNWDCTTSQYIIRVERGNDALEEGGAYQIKIKETKSQGEQSNSIRHAQAIEAANNTKEQDMIRQEYENFYQEELNKLHQDQFHALSEDEQYQGTSTVEELLARLEKGEQLTRQEMTYIKIFANLADYEKAETIHTIQNDLYKGIMDKAEQNGIEIPDEQWGIEIDTEGKISVTGNMPKKTKDQIETILKENFADELWNNYMQAADISNIQYRLINGYREVDQFIRKATEGQYSYKDVKVDENGKVSGLPEEICQLINSKSANARYEEIRDDIYMLANHKNEHRMKDIVDFCAKYQVSGLGMNAIEASSNVEWKSSNGYYKNMKPVK